MIAMTKVFALAVGVESPTSEEVFGTIKHTKME
jgi:hypothetical protein